MRGFIYDTDNDWVRQGSFKIEYPVVFHSDGSYSTRLYAQKSEFESIDAIIAPGGYRSVWIYPFDLVMEPDSVINQDIHLHVDYIDEVEKPLSVIVLPDT